MLQVYCVLDPDMLSESSVFSQSYAHQNLL